MTELLLGGGVRSALWHFCAIGLAAICEDAGARDTTVGWTAGLDAVPLLAVPSWTDDEIASAVQRHASRHLAAGSWVARGLMSPRITHPRDDAEWRSLGVSRDGVMDALLAERAVVDLHMIGALGEPAYWRRDRRGKPQPEDGASRWEMQRRNTGATFVENRLKKLAQTVSRRDPQAIRDGLTGQRIVDEIDHSPDSLTATGLAGPGPTDNAVAWCALWGISQLPVAHLILSPSRTAGHVEAPPGGPQHGWLCLPVPERPLPLPRLRTVLVSGQLVSALPVDEGGERPRWEDLDRTAARAWLLTRGVGAVVRFPIEETGSGKASGRRVLEGLVRPLRDLPATR